MSRDITTPLSGTDCCPSAGTSYRQPVHQIWSLYVNSLRRYERRRKSKNWGGLWGYGSAKVIGNIAIRYSTYDFLFDFNRKYASISVEINCRFWPTSAFGGHLEQRIYNEDNNK